MSIYLVFIAYGAGILPGGTPEDVAISRYDSPAACHAARDALSREVDAPPGYTITLDCMDKDFVTGYTMNYQCEVVDSTKVAGVPTWSYSCAGPK